jgi:hypothetical protein
MKTETPKPGRDTVVSWYSTPPVRKLPLGETTRLDPQDHLDTPAKKKQRPPQINTKKPFAGLEDLIGNASNLTYATPVTNITPCSPHIISLPTLSQKKKSVIKNDKYLRYKILEHEISHDGSKVMTINASLYVFGMKS